MNRRKCLVVLAALAMARPLEGSTSAGAAPLPVPGPFEVTCLMGTAAGNTTAGRDALLEYANADFSAFYWALGPATGTVAHGAFTSGFAAQADGGYRLSANRVFGVRIGAVYSFASAILDASNPSGDRLRETWSLELAVVPLLVGGWIERALSDDVLIRGSLFAGPAFGKVLLLDDWEVSGPSVEAERGSAAAIYRATTFAADLGAEFDWNCTRHLTLVVEAGYRLCRFLAMRAGRNLDSDGDGRTDVRAGDALLDGRGHPVPFSCSGFKAALGLRWRFDRR